MLEKGRCQLKMRRATGSPDAHELRDISSLKMQTALNAQLQLQ